MALEWAENELLMQRLEELANAPLSAIDRFRQEVPKIVEHRAIPAHELMDRISQFRAEISKQGEVKFIEFVKEAESMEQDLVRRVEQLREIRERAKLIRDLVRSMFRPALPPGVSDMVKRFFQGLESLRQREERSAQGS